MLFYYIPIASLLIFYFVITTTNINVFYDTHHSKNPNQAQSKHLQHKPSTALKPKPEPQPKPTTEAS